MRFYHSKISWRSLSEFLGKLSGIVASLLSKNHDLKSIEVGSLFSLVEFLHLLANWGGSPLLVELESFGSLGESAGSATSEDWESQSGESKSLQWVDGSWEFAVSIDEDSSEVNEVNDNDHFAVILSIIDEAYSTWFNEISKTL